METNDYEKKRYSISEPRSNPERLPHVKRQTPHPKVTDVKNRELLLFLLVIVIMIVLVIGGVVLYNGLTGDDSPGNSSSTRQVIR